MNRKEKTIYKENEFWRWKDPKTGTIHGPFPTRDAAREARKQELALKSVIRANEADKAA